MVIGMPTGGMSVQLNIFKNKVGQLDESGHYVNTRNK
jgi:hypothetical protein